MKSNFIAAGLVLALVSVSFASMAQTKTPRVREKQENQQKRIAGGVKSGELTAKETVRLEAQQGRIQENKKEAKSDGVVTTKERAKLHRQQTRASRNIHRQKHDAQSRP